MHIVRRPGSRTDHPADDGTVRRAGTVRRDPLDPAVAVGVPLRIGVIVAIDATEW
jgi:hypothetical protein